MDNAVKKYRKRREKRLAARGIRKDAYDGWITTENKDKVYYI